jgi:Fe-S cluster assembly protein SufD
VRRSNPVYTEQVDHYVAEQQGFAAERGSDPGWLADLRAEAIARFAEIGFPSTRLEEWKYTNVAPIAKLPLRFDTSVAITGAVSFRANLAEAPDSLRARIERSRDPKDRAFALLNTAFLAEGAIVRIPRNTDLEEPVRLAIAAPGDGQVRHPRILIDVEPSARAVVVIEHRPGEAGAVGLTNLVADIEVHANASLDLVIVQSETGGRSLDEDGDSDEAGFYISTVSARVARDGRFTSHTLSAGGSLVRNDLDVVLAEEGAECHLRGLFLGSGHRIVDNHTSVDHAVPNGSSSELYKGILGGRSKGIFRGRVLVRPDAQKTDATQSNPNLLLSEGAEIDTKPQLEIYADDVKCSHGATVGQLDEDALFYMRSRGIGLADARELMIRAFANEILDAIPIDDGALYEAIANSLQRTLSGDPA